MDNQLNKLAVFLEDKLSNLLKVVYSELNNQLVQLEGFLVGQQQLLHKIQGSV